MASNIDETADASSGLLIHDLSDHNIIFTFHKNNSYIENVNIFIDIKKRDEHSMSKFVNELISLDIYDKLDKQLNSDSNNNFEVQSLIFKYTQEKHLPKKKVKYQKKLHRKSK